MSIAIDAAAGKKAEQLLALDLRGLSAFTDTFIICHGTSTRHVQAIARAVEEQLRAAGSRPDHVEGLDAGEWVLMDYGDLVVHVFLEDRREHYRLERLWGDAPVLASPERRLADRS